MTDPNMGIARVLRPFWRFEYYYGLSGSETPVPGSRPIRLQPVNPTIPVQLNAVPPAIDPYAYDESARQGVTGYSPKLGAMLPMAALGSMSLSYLPQIPYLGESGGQTTAFMYAFVPVWRMRTAADWKRSKKQFAMPLERYGAPDSTGGASSPRFIIPGSRGAAIYMRPEPTLVGGANPSPLGFQAAYPEGIGMATGNLVSAWSPPFGPAADADNIQHTQQGIIDMGLTGYAGGQPFFRPYWAKVCGNEFAWDVYKVEIPLTPTSDITYRDWDFRYNNAGGSIGFCDGPGDAGGAGEDLAFSIVFGMGARTAVAGNANYGGAFSWSGAYVFNGVA